MPIMFEEANPLFEKAKEDGAAYVAFIVRPGQPLQVVSVMPGENLDAVRRFIREHGTDIKVCSTDKDLTVQLNAPINFK